MPVTNTAIIILGASGDLSTRKLIPSLSRLYEKKQIDASCIIVGSGRTDFDDTSFCNRIQGIGDGFKRILHYHTGMKGLRSYLKKKGSFTRTVFFLALPPSVYVSTVKSLYEEGFRDDAALIIEKPFGYNYQSAKELNDSIKLYFKESQIFRIDHYLAKEAVQNILVFRFANSLFYPVWNSRYIDSIQINALESTGIENRGAYFDKAGIIRDMVQNHLTQLLCLITMEAPVSLDADEIRFQKMNILKAMQIEECHRYQYEGYCKEKGVKENSKTETFVEIKLSINNFRWTGMPVYIRTGKATNRKGTEIGFKFKSLPKLLYNRNGHISSNRIIIKIQPAEGIIIDLASKIPGSGIKITNTNMSFCYRDSFSEEIPEAYQRLLLDTLIGNRTLFVSAEEAELSWIKYDSILDKGKLKYYKRGELPESSFTIEWIDFEKYGTICR
jgi:glucose-6-phosphate 1-dehydrogenase